MHLLSYRVHIGSAVSKMVPLHHDRYLLVHSNKFLENADKVNNKKGSARYFSSDELPPAGSSADIRRCNANRKADPSDDEFMKRYPRPKGKNDPRGPKIIVRKQS